MPSSSSGGGNSAAINGAPQALEIPPLMESVLRPHQVSALQFIWRRLVLDGALRTAARTFSATIEQRTRLYQEIFGAILAHSMGLGKTLTSLTFVLLLQAQVTLMAMKRERLRQQQQQHQQGNSGGGGGSSLLKGGTCPALRVLVLCPRSCVLHWQASIAEWVQPRYAGGVQLQVHVPSALGISTASGRGGGRTLDDVLLRYYQQGGLLVLGYEEYQRIIHYAHAQDRSSSATAATWTRVGSLMDRIRLPLPLTHEVRLHDVIETADLVILDEAHRLRRSSSNLVTALAQHLRNVQLRLALTGTPLQNHLEEYNTMQSVVTGRELDTQLFYKHFIAPIEHGQCVDSTYAQFAEMQRCVASLRNYFADSAHHCGPEVLAATLPPRREFIFFFRLSPAQEVAYKAMLKRIHRQLRSAEKGDSVLQLHHLASHICLHPVLAAHEEEENNNNNNGSSGVVAGSGGSSSSNAAAAASRVVRDSVEDEDDEASPMPASLPVSPVLPNATLRSAPLTDAPKLSFALHLTLHIVTELHEKVVIFSQYLSHLKLMGELLAQNGIAAPALTGGSTDAERRRCIDDLQTKDSCRVLLCSVRAGGVGIKLTAANHCILLDVSWNPADDTQATYRLYRYGQLRPVYIYRLATFGTSEHIVFAYALQKSWLQKKIADVSDPRRQQRHQTRSYFRYPCSVPLPESEAPEATSRAATSRTKDTREHALTVCETQCPAAAAVLAANAAVEGAHLVSVLPQSMLLQHHDDDVIRERARQFEEAALRKRATEPVPLQLHRGGNSSAVVQREELSLLEACETELVDVARQTAHLLITHVLRVQEEQARALDGQHSDTTSEVRTLDAILCRHLFPLIAARLERRPRPLALADVFLYCYQAGVERLTKTLLSGGAYLKLRTLLSSRIPAANRHRQRDAPLPPRSPLEDALLFRPVSLLRAMSAVEAMYVSTELGCDRALVGHCMLKGLQQLWYGGGGSAMNDVALRALFTLLGARAADEDDRDSSSDGETNVANEEHAAPVELRHGVLQALEGCLEEQWPPFEGLALPPQHLQLEREEMKLERAYSAATRANVAGVFPLGEAAELLRLPRYRQGHHTYGCARCHHLLLHRVDATHLECSRCHYNAEFEIRADVRTQQQATLYQLAVVTNLLDAFSTTRSFATSFSPAECGDVSAVLREVHSSQAALEFVRQTMREGVRVVLNEFPPLIVRLMGLQLGTGEDVEALARLLRTNGRYAVHTNMREHLRQRLAQAFADFVFPSTLTQLAAMPLLFIVAALHYTARHENLTYAHELLLEEYATPHRKLLRFASDALVKILYVERLLRHCKEKPQHTAVIASNAQRTKEPLVSENGVDDGDEDDAISLGSLLRAASSSSSSDASVQQHRRRRGRASSLASSSSSTFSSSSSSASSSRSSAHSDSSSGSEGAKRQRGVGVKRAPSSRAGAAHDAVVHSVSSSGSGTASDDDGAFSRSSSSSFHSVYSEDRPSFPDYSASEDEAEADTHTALDAAGTWLEALVQTAAPTAAELESEAVLQQRSAQYWIAYCEVYGTHSAETLTVLIEDEVSGVKALPPPPLSLWVSQVAHTTLVGMPVVDMLDLFIKKILELSQQVRLIA